MKHKRGFIPRKKGLAKLEIKKISKPALTNLFYLNAIH